MFNVDGELTEVTRGSRVLRSVENGFEYYQCEEEPLVEEPL